MSEKGLPSPPMAAFPPASFSEESIETEASKNRPTAVGSDFVVVDTLDSPSSAHSAISPVARRLLLGEDIEEEDEFGGDDDHDSSPSNPRQLPLGVPLAFGEEGDDDDNAEQHQHSLPNVEDLKTSLRESEGGIDGALSKTKKRFLSYLFAIVLALGLILVFAIATDASGKKKSTENNNNSNINISSQWGPDFDDNVAGTSQGNFGTTPGGTMDDNYQTFDDDIPATTTTTKDTAPAGSTDNDTASSSSENTLSDNGSGTSVGGYDDRVSHLKNYFVKHGVTSPAEFAPESPQSKAVDWLAIVDQQFEELPTHQEGLDTPQGYALVTRYAMAVLFYSTNGKDWIYSMNFLDPTKDTCEWWQIFPPPRGQNGVLCNANKEIVGLAIIANDLLGTLPAEISHLKTLTFFETMLNALSGTIPPEWQQLVNMKTLVMTHNQFTGTIPSWMPLVWPKLEVLYLSNNQLTGTIPEEFFGFQALTILALDDNMLTGRTDVFWKSLKSLEYLYLEDNDFTGTLPNLLADTNNDALVHLDISSNRITGNIPEDIFRLPRLQVLDLHNNKLVSFPDDIPPNNANLQHLALHKNLLQGSLPPTISNLRKLSHLDVSQNRLTGMIPFQLQALSDTLSYLFLGANDYRLQPIPSLVYALTNLKELSLKSSNLEGTISEVIGALDSLVLLDLDDNRLTGTIPYEIGALTNLQFLLLNRNQLTSSVPAQSLVNLNKLHLLLLDQNHIVGDLNPICALDSLMVVFVDCGEVSCLEGCCNCCTDGQPCHDMDQVPSMEPLWEANYKRQFFDFSSKNNTEVGVFGATEDDYWE